MRPSLNIHHRALGLFVLKFRETEIVQPFRSAFLSLVECLGLRELCFSSAAEELLMCGAYTHSLIFKENGASSEVIFTPPFSV